MTQQLVGTCALEEEWCRGYEGWSCRVVRLLHYMLGCLGRCC